MITVRKTTFLLFLQVVIIVLVGFFICNPTIDNYFLGDDFGHIQFFHSKTLTHFPKLFLNVNDAGEDLWGEPNDTIRPILSLSFKLNYYFFGVNPIGYHLVNIILHILNSLLIYLIVITLTSGRNWVAFVSSLLFIVAPVHSEPISWITGAQVDSLPTFFYLGAFLFFALFRSTLLLRYYCLSIVMFVLGLFTKEILITLPLMLISYDVFFKTAAGGKTPFKILKSLITYAPFCVLVLFYLCLRRVFFGDFVREQLIGINTLREFLTQQGHNFRYLLLPFDAVIKNRPLTLYDCFTLILAGITLSIFLISFIFLLRDRSKYNKAITCILYFGMVWYLISIISLIVTYPSPRHLYLPSCGIYIAIAFLLVPFSLKHTITLNIARLATIVFLIALYGYTLVKDNSDWVKAGIISQKAKVGIEKSVETIPKGSTIIISDIPASNGKSWVWRWVLPFALQKPFSNQDLYSNFQIIESPELYCCPVENWWKNKKQIIISLLSTQTEDNLDLYALQWDHQSSSIILKRNRIEKEHLRTQIEYILKQPVENTETIDEKAATLIMETLAGLFESSALE